MESIVWPSCQTEETLAHTHSYTHITWSDGSFCTFTKRIVKYYITSHHLHFTIIADFKCLSALCITHFTWHNFNMIMAMARNNHISRSFLISVQVHQEIRRQRHKEKRWREEKKTAFCVEERLNCVFESRIIVYETLANKNRIFGKATQKIINK